MDIAVTILIAALFGFLFKRVVLAEPFEGHMARVISEEPCCPDSAVPAGSCE